MSNRVFILSCFYFLTGTLFLGCVDEQGDLCAEPKEERSWHYRNDTRFSWCASCDNTLADDALVEWAAARGWEGDPTAITPCFFTPQGSPSSAGECRLWVCQEEQTDEEPIITKDTPMGRMITRQRADF